MDKEDIERAVEIAAQLCIVFEGVYLKPYLCPAGVPTIGVGSTEYENGVRVTLADPPITLARAKQLLMVQLTNKYAPGVVRLCPRLEAPAELGAIIDLAYNIGLGNLAASTLRRRINADDLEGAKAELKKWVRGGGKVLPGLVKRRNAEAALL